MGQQRVTTGPGIQVVAGRDGRPLFELPDELRIEPGRVQRRAVAFVREQLRKAGRARVVLGLSGGVDSALVAYLVAEAIGPVSLRCLLMPYRTSSPSARADAEAVVRELGCAAEVVDVSPMVDAYFDGRPDAGALRRGNFMARTRMAVLYDRAGSENALVAGTGNRTETLVGYATLHGDAAWDFNPIGELFKSQVRQLAAAVGVPEPIIRKAPSADLWPGQTDESEVGVTYPVLDRILHARVDEGRSRDAAIALGFDAEVVDRIDRLVARSAFKRRLPPVARLASRHAHLDH
jgi:NAD+ synthase